MNANLRKAAVLLRSLDGDTAALMLGRLSPEEAAAIRGAMRTLGPPDADQQADVIAELRGERPRNRQSNSGDVELSLSSLAHETSGDPYTARSAASRVNRFEFLESAPTSALVPYLAREHAQTIAVVLSHLAPQRAANVLAALPQKIQTDTIERLSTLGETDPDTLTVLERELEGWFAKRAGGHAARRDTMTAILAAADAKTRSSILSNMKNHNDAVANPLSSKQPPRPVSTPKPRAAEYRSGTAKKRPAASDDWPRDKITDRSAVRRVPPAPLPRIAFDDLIHLDSRTLASVLRQADANVLALALAGSRDELVDRICAQMPKRTARTFRRELRRLGPTRLSDVEAAQQAIAQLAAQQRVQVSLNAG